MTICSKYIMLTFQGTLSRVLECFKTIKLWHYSIVKRVTVLAVFNITIQLYFNCLSWLYTTVCDNTL